jgi:hypothetical protein
MVSGSPYSYLRFFLEAGATIAVLDEYVMRLLPAKVESAVPGGFTAS